jgi:hemoglobin
MAAEDSLYRRIGGYDVIATVVDAFLGRLVGDSSMARFVTGMNHERQRRNRQLTLDFLAHAAGGPVLYLGQDMRTAHEGLAISSDEWTRAVEHFRAAVDHAAIAPSESRELLGLFESQREAIIED